MSRLGDDAAPVLVPLQARGRSAWTIRHAGHRYAVFDVGGQLQVTDAACPHHGGPLAKGAVGDGVVTCPWHWYRFDLRTGECYTVPGYRLRLYPVITRAGRRFAALPRAPQRDRRRLLRWRPSRWRH